MKTKNCIVLQTNTGTAKSANANRDVSCAHPPDADITSAAGGAPDRDLTGARCHGATATNGAQTRPGGYLRQTGRRQVRDAE